MSSVHVCSAGAMYLLGEGCSLATTTLAGVSVQAMTSTVVQIGIPCGIGQRLFDLQARVSSSAWLEMV